MTKPLSIAITGASGFLGRLLVQMLRRQHRVIALDRRPLIEAAMADHPNLEWYQVDLADEGLLERTMACIRAGGGADVLIHLAAYYDFSGENHPEYERTNVDAMRSLLEHSRMLDLDHFVFASSVAACRFSSPGRPITESTPPHGSHIYARTKRAGEEMLAEFADSFTPVIVRFAAMFSDWCEYPPLQVMLDTWLSSGWDARVIAGRGRSAIPYLHVRDGAFFMKRLLERRRDLDPMEVLIAGADGAVSHEELYRAATAYVDGRPRQPIHLPKVLCKPGIWVRDLAGRAFGGRPFERTWMADYVDRRMEIDASRTRHRLGWQPTPRLCLLERLPFLLEHRRGNPLEWYRRNREALEHLQVTPNFRIYQLLKKYEAAIEQAVESALEARSVAAAEPLRLSAEQRFWDHRVTLRNLIVAVRSGENEPFLNWCRDLAERRLGEGFAVGEVVAALRIIEEAIHSALQPDPDSPELEPAIRDLVDVPVQFGIDRVLEIYEDSEIFGFERPT